MCSWRDFSFFFFYNTQARIERSRRRPRRARNECVGGGGGEQTGWGGGTAFVTCTVYILCTFDTGRGTAVARGECFVEYIRHYIDI